jgi:hypothetical protein
MVSAKALEMGNQAYSATPVGMGAILIRKAWF